jgi:hypothetical protein
VGAGRITVKVKQLSELLAGQDETASAAVPTARTAEDGSNIFGEEDETFDAMVQRHRFSWNDINPADYVGYVWQQYFKLLVSNIVSWILQQTRFYIYFLFSRTFCVFHLELTLED